MNDMSIRSKAQSPNPLTTVDLDALYGVYLKTTDLPDTERQLLIDAMQELRASRAALAAINDIRNSIVGYQKINWSAHIYPLVAALEGVGIHGEGYDVASERAQTQVERINELETVLQRVHCFFDPECDEFVANGTLTAQVASALRLTENPPTHKGN